jgi:DmsE family decaheme c-type cytochrome
METDRRASVRRGFPPRLIAWLLPLLGAGLCLVSAADEPKYVGEETCVQCHVDQGETWKDTAHARAGVEGWDGAAGCETCHGPGEAHVEADGDPEQIVGRESEHAVSRCLSCHGGNSAAHWEASTHDDFDVTCVDCHTVHQRWTNETTLANKNTSGACLSCHQDMRKHMYQRSRHPLREGLMSCASCHTPHGSDARFSIAALTPNDKCYECHAETRGPFLFPHQPVQEDCMLCHNPHGSNQASLLEPAPPRLCQSCHLFGHHQTVPGLSEQVWNTSRSCVNCHARIHGSNHPSGVVFLR